MYLSRPLTLGLLGIAVVLLLDISAALVREPTRASAPLAAQHEPVSVVDVARGVSPSELATFVRLRGDERVVAVDDQAVANDLAAGALIANRTLGSGSFLDLTVGGRAGQRRVLVLLH